MPQEITNPHNETDQYSYSIEITKPCGAIGAILDWVKDESAGDWRWNLEQPSSAAQPGIYIFYFDLEVDYFAFVIKFA